MEKKSDKSVVCLVVSVGPVHAGIDGESAERVSVTNIGGGYEWKR